jgi:hypothetical protein
MAKWVIGGILGTLGIIKLTELLQAKDSLLGNILFWVVVISWIYEAGKSMRESR